MWQLNQAYDITVVLPWRAWCMFPCEVPSKAHQPTCTVCQHPLWQQGQSTLGGRSVSLLEVHPHRPVSSETPTYTH